jgi:hypothetical protein
VEIIHQLQNEKVSKRIKNNVGGFLLTNKNLGYVYFSNSLEPRSRYEGVFFPFRNKIFRVISELNTGKRVEKVRNKFYLVERELGGGNKESFFMPFKLNSLIYELEKECWVDLKLDIREIYSQERFGRYHEIFEDDEKVVIKYTKRDEQTNEQEYECFLVINGSNLEYGKIERWEEVSYPYDKIRNSPPFSSFIFHALKLKSSRLIFSFSEDKEEAIKESSFIMKNLNRLKRRQKKDVEKEPLLPKLKRRGKIPIEVKFAYNCCLNSLNQLTSDEGIIAGLPWFFQFWTRDELISLKNFDKKEKKRILLRYLKNIANDGRLINILRTKETNADSIGWLFKRIFDSLNMFNRKEKKLIREKLIQSINRIEKNYLKDGLIYNNAGETWMDSSFGDDEGREGARVEIQASFLNMLALAHKLTNDEKYLKTEKKLRETVREKLWNGKILADGLNDFTLRPNIFLAYYFYPRLLSRREWENCFRHSLPNLWLNWGGFSSIDKKSPSFFSYDTGGDPKSYHHGNSWFFLNNLAALVLYKVNRKKFEKYVEKILKSSARDILWLGAIGHHSEISSAEKQEARGCVAQAWSAALYIELINEASLD